MVLRDPWLNCSQFDWFALVELLLIFGLKLVVCFSFFCFDLCDILGDMSHSDDDTSSESGGNSEGKKHPHIILT